MKSKRKVLLILCFSLCLTGCWDRIELNDLAFILGWGLDLTKDGEYEGIAQFIIPSKLGQGGGGSGGGGGGGKEQGFFIETGTGKTITDTSNTIQTKISRKIFASHRRDIFIGESLARHGITKVIDEFSRNPDIRLRTDFFVVKGATAKEFLSIPNKLENIPALAALKLHQTLGGPGSASFRDFLIAANTEGSSPTLPTLEIVSSPSTEARKEKKQEKTIQLSGRAIFNNELKLVGFIDNKENYDRLLLTGELKEHTYTDSFPEGKGEVNFHGVKFKSKIQPNLQGDNLKFDISIQGKGWIVENNSVLDLKQSSAVRTVERTISKDREKQVLQLITKVQKELAPEQGESPASLTFSTVRMRSS